MDTLNKLLDWMAPIIHPLDALRGHINTLADIHSNSVSQFNTLSRSLTAAEAGSDEAFIGEAAETMITQIEAYLKASALVGANTGAGGAGSIGLLEEAAVASETCVTELTAAAEVAVAEAGGESGLAEVAAGLDVGAAAQGGLDVPWDIVAAIVTAIEVGLIIGTLVKLGWDIYHAIKRWEKAMHNTANQPMPTLPPNPTPATVPVTPLPPIKLNEEQQKRFEQLAKDFPDIDPDFIKMLIKKGLSDAQIREILVGFTGKKLPDVPLTPDQKTMVETLKTTFPDADPAFLAALIGSGLSLEQASNLLANHRQEVPYLTQLYAQLANIPGIEKVLRDMGVQDSKYAGSTYQMLWVLAHLAAHKDNILRVEDHDAGGKSAADVVLKNGDVIDLKNYGWYKGYYKKTSNIKRTIKEFEEQVLRYKKLYPDKKITYVFNTAGMDKNDMSGFEQVKKALEDMGVEVETWP
ncbi:hypothetical protein KDA_56060 [Dictyobacter alpinus]|uniref:Uncharacterized protein n=1 Tax=Dictyobacter alpinus TaxID=2014873 RepID=A0A402BFT0_9CHLR|nr:hypothetical protein [Dictyobacter alpinus]GCE30122.1 hypothetical protein KDA_56060 [Dictyobacter alpinus]